MLIINPFSTGLFSPEKTLLYELTYHPVALLNETEYIFYENFNKNVFKSYKKQF